MAAVNPGTLAIAGVRDKPAWRETGDRFADGLAFALQFVRDTETTNADWYPDEFAEAEEAFILDSPDLSGHSLSGYTLVATRATISALLLCRRGPVPHTGLPEDDGDRAIVTSLRDWYGDYGSSWAPVDARLLSLFLYFVRVCNLVSHLVCRNGPDSLKSFKVNFFSIGICYP